MADFIDKLKQRLAPAASTAPAGAPIFLMVGSLSGVTRKDAVLYARGLAESNVISAQLGRVLVTHDKAGDRYVYEIHEGGIEHSIAEKVMAAIDAGTPVRIALANGAHLTVEDAHGELFSLIHPPASAHDDVRTITQGSVTDVDAAPVIEDVTAYAGATPLQELFPENAKLFKLGVILMAVSAVVFVTSGLLFGIKQAGWLDKDALMLLTKAGHGVDVADSPMNALEKASVAAGQANTHIETLTKTGSKWAWKLGQAN